MKQALTILMLISLLLSSAMASDKENPLQSGDATPESIIEAGLDLFLVGEYARAVDNFFSNTDRRLLNETKLNKTKNFLETNIPQVGKLLRYEFVSHKQLSHSMIRLRYMIAGEAAPIMGTFYFYKPEQKWYLADFNITDTIVQLDDLP